MSFKNLEGSLRTLDDVSGASRLRARIRELEEERLKKEQDHAREKKKLEENIVSISATNSALKARTKELAGLRIVYQKDRYNLRGIDGLVRKRMDKKVKKQIKIQALELYLEQRPSLIEEEINGYPITCSEGTRRTVEEKSTHLLNEYLRNPSIWPPWFKVQVREETEKQVKERMGQVFWDNVQQRTDQEINQRLPIAWLSFLRGKATSFMKNTLQTQLRSLMATLEITCPRCGGVIDVSITPDAFSHAIRKGYVSSLCPYSKGFFKHKIMITLGELFLYIIKGDVIPVRVLSYSRVRETDL